jgi:hypothetical protein
MSRKKSEEITVEVTPPTVPPPGLEDLIKELREAIEKLNKTITLFSSIIAEGLKTKPYNRHIFTIATEPITSTGASYDLGFEVDEVVVIPNINAKIEFNQPVTDQTPVTLAGTSTTAKYKVKEIFYKSEKEGETGKLAVWAFWWESER